MTNLRTALDGLVREGEDYIIEAPEQWSQGRTLYGGMTAALCYEAAKRTHADLPPLRSAQFTFVGPAAGRLRLRADLLRRGRSSAIISADCRNEEGLAARSMFVFGAARESQTARALAPWPSMPPPAACEPFHRTSKPLKGFVSNFEMRLAAGARPFQQDARPEFHVWIRLLDDEGVDPVSALLAIADGLPPAAMVNLPRPAAISTITWALDLFQPVMRSDGWRLLSAVSESMAEGYSLQSMMLRNEAGEPLAAARQVVAIFF